MKKQGWLFLVIGLMMLGALSGCVNPVTSIVSVKGVAIAESSLGIGLVVGESKTLTVQINPSNATNKDVTWTVKDPSIATVDNTGKVTGVKAGQTEVEAKTEDGDFTAACVVIVSTIPVASITLSDSNVEMQVYSEYQLVATITPASATDKTITWTSSDTSVIIPVRDGNGKVFAVGTGTAVITAATNDRNKTAQCTITVKN